VPRPRHATVVTPCSGQLTRGTAASSLTRTAAKSRCRHRRRGPPRSSHGPRRPHRPQRGTALRRGRTATTRRSRPAASSMTTDSTTTPVSPSSRFHMLVSRTSFPVDRFEPSTSQKRIQGTACAPTQGLNPPTRSAVEPLLSGPASAAGGSL
jgi:hypothetical protein